MKLNEAIKIYNKCSEGDLHCPQCPLDKKITIRKASIENTIPSICNFIWLIKEEIANTKSDE